MVKTKKIKPKKIYLEEKCHYIHPNGKRCKRNAIGSGQLCKQHGGELDRSSLINEEEQASQLALMKRMKPTIVPYDPSFHPMKMIKLSREGLSEVEIAAQFGISVRRLQKWSEDYEIFSEAYDLSQAIYESWWLIKGKEGLDNPRDFNTPLYKFLTGNKLGYSDKVESKNFNVTAGVLVVPKTPNSLEEWEANCKEITEKEKDECLG
jgi:DNA-binding transcriptional regulator YiaG